MKWKIKSRSYVCAVENEIEDEEVYEYTDEFKAELDDIEAHYDKGIRVGGKMIIAKKIKREY